MRRFLIRSFLFLSAVILVLIGAIVTDFVFFRGRTPRIANAPTGVAALEKIKLGGVEQWILVRGHRTANPVVLFLHGGPGMPAMFLAHKFQRKLEEDFVMVHWDRRGAGKSFLSGVTGDINVRQTLDDTYELTRLLQKRFGRERIYLVGHSWGSYLGMLAAWEHPEYYAAYVGMGQMSADSAREFAVRKEFFLQKAREANDSILLKNLESVTAKIGEDDLFRYGTELFGAKSMWPLLFVGLRAPEYTFRDALHVKKGADMVIRKMRYNVIAGSLMEHVREIKIPLFFFLGRHDYNTPSVLAEEYFNALTAPQKKLVWFEKSAHFPFFEEPESFHSQLVKMDAEARHFWSIPKNSGHESISNSNH